MKEVINKMYVADDGTQFSDKSKCEEYERNSAHTIEVEAYINAVIRLDGVRVKLPVDFNGDLNELSNPEIFTHFLDRAWDAFMDTDNYLTAGELLKIARKQGKTPYLDCYEDVDICGYRVLKG